jgi:hypothetical protein
MCRCRPWRWAWLSAPAFVVFAVSLTARTVDRPLCTDIPIGTHFVWHILNAVVLLVVGYAVLDRYLQRA